MPPLTLAVLASVLRMHGADAAITSDNKGIDDLLADIRGHFAEQIGPNTPQVILAATAYTKAIYEKGVYMKGHYWKSSYGKGITRQPSTAPTNLPPRPGTIKR